MGEEAGGLSLTTVTKQSPMNWEEQRTELAIDRCAPLSSTCRVPVKHT
jgi:hypothetical protein